MNPNEVDENTGYLYSKGYKTYNEMQTGFLPNGMYRPGTRSQSISSHYPMIQRQPLVAMQMNTMRPIQMPVNMQMSSIVPQTENSQTLNSDQSQQQHRMHQQITNPRDLPELEPYIEIVEQPSSRDTRFRYQSESLPSGQRAGRIPGKNSTPEKQTFPSIKVHNCVGKKVKIVVSCVTANAPYKVHPHKITSKELSQDGVICLTVNGGEVVNFTSLGIQCAKKKDVVQSIKEREDKKIDPFGHGFDHKKLPSTIDLNAVRLAFQGFIKNGSEYTIIPPVVSEPIYDKKSWNELVIQKLSHYSAKVSGGKEIMLLCDKVSKEDIQIRFFEEENEEVVWEGKGNFTASDVFKQSIISFRTPTYKDLEIEKPVKVFVQLRRPSDGATSSPVNFEMKPIKKKCDMNHACCKRFQSNGMKNQHNGLDREKSVKVPMEPGRRFDEAARSIVKYEMQPVVQGYDTNLEKPREERFETNEIKIERNGLQFPDILPEEVERLLDADNALRMTENFDFQEQTMLETQRSRNSKRKLDLQYGQPTQTNFDIPQKMYREMPEIFDNNYYEQQHFSNAQNYYQSVQQQKQIGFTETAPQMETTRNISEEYLEDIDDYLKRHAAIYNRVSMYQGS